MDVLDFGKYNVYIWASYLITFLVLLLNIVLPLMSKKKILNGLKRRYYLDNIESNNTGSSNIKSNNNDSDKPESDNTAVNNRE